MSHNLNFISDYVFLRVGMGIQRRGKGGGVWHFNAKLLLNEDYVKSISDLISSESSKGLFLTNIIEGWEVLKLKIKRKSINFAKRLSFQNKLKEKQLRSKLMILQQQLNVNVGDFLSVRDELFELDKVKCEGAILRSKAQYAVEGEKNTAFFLNLEKTRQSRVYIDKLKNKEGDMDDSFVSILENVQTYYEALFCSEVHDVILTEHIVNHLDVKLSNVDKVMCDQFLTVKDINNAIDQLLQNKSPGSDGLTANFYVCFRSVLVPILLKLYHEIEIQRVVPGTMAEGLITLLFKKGDRTDIANYRPITLLNTDYKILMKIFANRFKSVINTIVSPTQAYSIPGREVTDIILTIRDAQRQRE